MLLLCLVRLEDKIGRHVLTCHIQSIWHLVELPGLVVELNFGRCNLLLAGAPDKFFFAKAEVGGDDIPCWFFKIPLGTSGHMVS